MIYGKWNQGKSEWSLSHDMDGRRSKDAKSTQLAEYTLTDGSINQGSKHKSAEKRINLSDTDNGIMK